MVSKKSVSSTHTATLIIWWHLIQKMTNLKKMLFRAEMWVRVKIKLKIVFETIDFIYPENLGLLGLFLSKIE